MAIVCSMGGASIYGVVALACNLRMMGIERPGRVTTKLREKGEGGRTYTTASISFTAAWNYKSAYMIRQRSGVIKSQDSKNVCILGAKDDRNSGKRERIEVRTHSGRVCVGRSPLARPRSNYLLT